ncbi:hypothetical protein H3H37_02635 [Duganella sp. LX20W]|uniref:Uncharacterized protein n=1 Tax=Rugamonas brunnea TaxID=2758569 RepID=A0A7W2EP83_9BURK|nr:hypothetical protein [Rugamonas brunnea]MBA5635944.1 hypothetical protein [Rugamonas brunnea]
MTAQLTITGARRYKHAAARRHAGRLRFSFPDLIPISNFYTVRKGGGAY